jgi:hypothetical protein
MDLKDKMAKHCQERYKVIDQVKSEGIACLDDVVKFDELLAEEVPKNTNSRVQNGLVFL